MPINNRKTDGDGSLSGGGIMFDEEVHKMILDQLKYVISKLDEISGTVAGDHALLHEHLEDQGNKPERMSVTISVVCVVITIVSLVSATIFASEKVKEKGNEPAKKVNIQNS